MLSPRSASCSGFGTRGHKKCAGRERHCLHCRRMLTKSLTETTIMFWNLFRLQALLDSLFDEGWLSMEMPEEMGYDEGVVVALMPD